MSREKTSDPYADAAAHLQSKGWRPVGDPRLPFCRWLDPIKPNSIEQPNGTYKRVKVLAPDVNGDLRPVFVKGKDGRPEEVSQVHWTPPVEPLETQAAMQIQMTREYEAAAREMAAAGAN